MQIVTTGGKSQVSGRLQLSQSICDRLKMEKDLKIMMYAAPEGPISAYSASADIAFPQHVEVRINQDPVSSNFKGVKGKPGSTRPADITNYIRKLPTYKNEIQITFAYTDKVGSDFNRVRICRISGIV
jgi:E3 SUMO-protein ligase PIAS1